MDKGDFMELADIKAIWREYDRKIDAGVRLNAETLLRVNLSKVERTLASLARGTALEWFASLAALLLIGSFAADHHDQPGFLVPAVIVGMFAVMLVAAQVRRFVELRTVDYAQPVATLQERLARLRIRRIEETKWIFLCAPALWVPLLVVALRGLFGIDAYTALGPAYLSANAIFGIAVIPVGLWAARTYGDRLERSSMVRSLVDDIAGRSLVEALQALENVRSFVDDPVRA